MDYDRGDSNGEAGRRRLGGLPVVQPQVAGIDIGSEQHGVCAPTVDGTAREIAKFGATTRELMQLAEWLKQRPVASVAMESTGVYWIAAHEVLEAAGFGVLLVNTRQLAQVPGRDRKSDPSDCEWIQRLHSCGLLRGSFRPPEQVCLLRTLVRDKTLLVAASSDWLRRMQKTLDQMNVRLQRAVSDIDGATGMAILRAIAAGERDAAKLAQLRHAQCRKSEQEIAAQLTGHWREDHLFSLCQALKMYDAIQQRKQKQGDRDQSPPPVRKANKQRLMRKRGEEPLREALYRLSGVDLTTIDAIGVGAVQVVLSEYGPDLSRFPSEKEFVSHLTLAPRVASSGGKPVRKKKPRSASSRVAAALRMAALSLRQTQTARGAYCRSLACRLGGDVAVFATARKLAQLIFRLLRGANPTSIKALRLTNSHTKLDASPASSTRLSNSAITWFQPSPPRPP
jgi:transposase